MAYDVFVLICAAGGVALGAKRGFSVHAAGIVALVLGFALGVPLAKLINGALGDTTAGGRLLVFLGCFAVITLVVNLLGARLRSRLKERSLETWDRQLGAALGLLHGLLVCLMLTFAAVVIAPSLREPIGDRPSGRAMGKAFVAIHSVLPEDLQEGMEPLIDRARSAD